MARIPKKYIYLSIILILSILISQTASANEWTGNVNMLLGVKMLDENDWEPVEEQGELAILLDFRKENWPISVEMALSGSYDTQEDIIGIDDVNKDGSTGEFRFGIRKTFEIDEAFRPYLGGGLAVISAKEEWRYAKLTLNDEDTNMGLWIHGGIYWTVSSFFNVGFDVGYTSAKVSIFNKDMAAGGGHFAMFIGYHW